VSEGDSVIILAEPRFDAPEVTRFEFPRQRRDRHLCLADFFRTRDSGEVDVIGFTVVTMGQRIADFANKLFAANAYRDYLEVHGLSVQLTEALAEFWHQRIRSELMFADGTTAAAEDDPDVERFFDLAYRGARYSFGYPACPDLADQVKVMRLLQPERIGVTLSEEYQLHPEQSTSALIAHHPEAKYFAAR
jgi:5-methyltetrahydrofolate--homocysteine methyltransferase